MLIFTAASSRVEMRTHAAVWCQTSAPPITAQITGPVTETSAEFVLSNAPTPRIRAALGPEKKIEFGWCGRHAQAP